MGIFYRVFSAVLYQFGKYVIDVKIKDDKEVIIVADGWYKKSTCWISAYFYSDILTINAIVMSTQTWCLFLWRKNYSEEAVSVSVTVLSLDITSYDSLFL